MFKELEKLKDSLEYPFRNLDEGDLKEWRAHPVTKAFKAHLKHELLTSLETIQDVPTDEHSIKLHTLSFGKRDLILDLLNGDYMEESNADE